MQCIYQDGWVQRQLSGGWEVRHSHDVSPSEPSSALAIKDYIRLTLMRLSASVGIPCSFSEIDISFFSWLKFP